MINKTTSRLKTPIIRIHTVGITPAITTDTAWAIVDTGDSAWALVDTGDTAWAIVEGDMNGDKISDGFVNEPVNKDGLLCELLVSEVPVGGKELDDMLHNLQL